MREEITFSRNAEAIMIPSGEKVLVPKGAQATITQSLGGTYTLITDRGLMVRVSGQEVEAIGKTPEQAVEVKPEELTPEKLEDMVWDQLKTCFDPEIPVNIVDLGLVYGLDIDEGGNVEVIMTLTSMGCPLGPVIERDIRSVVSTLPGIKNVKMTLTFSPPWDPSRMTDDARMELGYWG